MNLRQIQYAVTLSELRSFSQAAEELNISQPALSKQIQSLENELQLKLFDRNSVPLGVTEAGEYFVREARTLLDKESQLLGAIEQYKSGTQNSLKIGISPFRCLYLLPKAMKNFKEKYPNIPLEIIETGSNQLREDAAAGKYDFAVVNLPVDESVLEVIPLEPDSLVLAVPCELAKNIKSTPTNSYPEVNFKDLRDMPFVMVSHGQEMRNLCELLCENSGFKPRLAAEVVGLATAWAMAEAGIGATLLPYQFIAKKATNGAISLFTVKNTRYARQPVVVFRRGKHLSEAAKYAIELLTQN